MGRTTDKSSQESKRRHKPATTSEARENQIIDAAWDLAEQQIREGTASSQVITYFLKAGSSKEKLELEKLREENKLLVAKTEMLQTTKQSDVDYAKVLQAFRSYSGGGGNYDD